MYHSNRLLPLSASQSGFLSIKVSMEIKGNGATTALEIFKYYYCSAIFSNAQIRFQYVNLVHL